MLSTRPQRLPARALRRLLPLVIGVVLLGSCRDAAPTGPSAQQATPVLGLGAEQSWDRTSIFVDVIVFVECLGENVRFFGEVPIHTHQVTSGSGNVNVHVQVRPVTLVDPPFVAVGQTSGRLFQPANLGQPINQVIHLAAGEVGHVVHTEYYVAEDGDRLIASESLHLTVNANGDVTVSRFEPLSFRCVDR